MTTPAATPKGSRSPQPNPDDQTRTVRQAQTYARLGWRVVPLNPRSKKPIGNAWQKQRLTEEELPGRFGHGENLGVLLGDPSGGLTDIDLDCREARELASQFLPHTEAIFGRASSPRSHYEYLADPLPGPTKYTDPLTKEGEEHSTLIELRTTGQTMFPPSTHTSGEVVAWTTDGAVPPTVDGAEIDRAVRKVAAAALLARYWPTGHRHDATLALAGGLLRGGWTPDDTWDFIRAIGHVAGDEEIDDREVNVRSTAAKLESGDAKVTGWPKLGDYLKDKVIAAKAREWLQID
nr:bifunctional DNA primase/polymerase [Actinomycetota bacterium]